MVSLPHVREYVLPVESVTSVLFWHIAVAEADADEDVMDIEVKLVDCVGNAVLAADEVAMLGVDRYTVPSVGSVGVVDADTDDVLVLLTPDE